MIDLVFNNFTTDRKYGGEFFEKVVGVATKELGLESKKVELSINLVGEGRIKALNKKYRGRNRVTDVLSFPLISGHRKTRGLAMTEISIKPGANGIMNLGDIFICLPVAKKYVPISDESRNRGSSILQSKIGTSRENVSLDYKLAFLTVHGFLHLLGYDHEQASQQERMFKIQNEILNKVLVVRG